MVQKLSTAKKDKSLLLKAKVHEPLVRLMETRDIVVLHCSLHALNSLTGRYAAARGYGTHLELI